ncbi:MULTISPECIES: HlyD family type I secretion periplasmic adaptor subunit [unclassified Sphingomonas]|uniref:HlyD family type I secretion periplasmic adaptor subunit n=1 Tax=unclassified Sphingomonas TaxID=196159 RepID=UPI00285B65A6|nr:MULTISPECIES: HlyD family type I secretion periplasmic adaptor subunit [unclassified Sphingomonas]MDR6115791.1 hemolysin D [Sphingomonas sp. SORGH_AS_0789]MDR6150538.1 hemolysin D [Sphingomonas sp. SORGH_AS_0742]
MSTLAQNWALFRTAWSEDRAERRGAARPLEHSFLPAALEVIERPVSPTARITAWLLMGGLALTGGWLVLGKVDVVASAQGRTVPAESVKLVQSATGGIVRRIWVHEGDVVRRGQPLVDLDPTLSSADEAQARQALLAAEIDVARNAAIVDGLSGGAGAFTAPEGTPADVAATQRRLVAAQIAGARATEAGLAAARRSALSDAEAAAQQMRTYAANQPLLDRQVQAVETLAQRGYASGMRVLEMQRQQRAEAGNRNVAAAQRTRGLSEAGRYAEELARSREQARQIALSDLSKAQTEAMQRREELTKARQHSRMQRLTAPVDGTVQQLSVHTLGGVVESVRPLMVVVPNGQVTVEAKLLNRDIGFVRAGQSVAVKLEAYPFTRYGTVPGHILSVSRDAVTEEKSAPYYLARIALDRRTIGVDGRQVPLTPGLSATADIRTGQRRLIEYLIDPVSRDVSEAARER